VCKLAGFKDGTFNVVRAVTTSEREIALRSLAAIDKFDIEQQLWLLAKLNQLEFTQGLEGDSERLRSAGMAGRAEILRLRFSVNRRLLNFLSSMRAYIDQSEHLLSKKFGRDSAEFRAFKELQNTEYDNRFEYRFAYHLRNYVVHVESPISNISVSFGVDHQETRSFELRVEIDPDELLKSGYEWNSTVRSDLQRLTEPINLLGLVAAAGLSLDALGACRISLESAPAIEALRYLDKFAAEVGAGWYPCLLPEKFPEQGGHRIEWFPMESLQMLRMSLRM